MRWNNDNKKYKWCLFILINNFVAYKKYIATLTRSAVRTDSENCGCDHVMTMQYKYIKLAKRYTNELTMLLTKKKFNYLHVDCSINNVIDSVYCVVVAEAVNISLSLLLNSPMQKQDFATLHDTVLTEYSYSYSIGECSASLCHRRGITWMHARETESKSSVA